MHYSNLLSAAKVLIIFTLSTCTMPKKYTIKKIDGELIINGIIKKEVLMNTKNYPWFNKVYNAYLPEPKYIKMLQPLAKELKVLIIAGSWCGDTKRELPVFYKVADQIELNSDQVELIMVDKNKKCNVFNISILQVSNIPTFIIYINGKEKGRIIESTTVNMEHDMAEILQIIR
ncbi:MAG: thioredoxin family protein [Bacteroidia bacterium]|nr:thioredoxin family protein [Bacteroidia bacterium]